MYESMKAYRQGNNYPKRHISPDSAKIPKQIKVRQKYGIAIKYLLNMIRNNLLKSQIS